MPTNELAPEIVNALLARQGERMRAARAAQAMRDTSPAWYEQALPMEGRAAFLPFQDTLPGSVMNERKVALPGILAGALNAFSAPGRALSGSNPNFNSEEEAANFALNLMGGGIGASKISPAPNNALGMFIGKSAKTWDSKMAAMAVEMEKAGVDAKTIWQQTGTWRSPDGMWRQEIPDSSSKFRLDFNLTGPNKGNAYSAPTEYALGGAFNHPELYRAYPNMLSTERINIGKYPDWFPDSANYGEYIKGNLSVRNKTEAGATSTVLHELQHAVQQIEGFSKGGMPINFYNKALSRLAEKNPQLSAAELAPLANKEAFAYYRSLMGEAEARATQARANLTAAERKNLFPEQSYDLPLHLLQRK